MPTWKIPGQNLPPASEPAVLQPGRFDKEVFVETTELIRVGATRAGAEPALLKNVAPDDLLEIELEGGVRQWMLAEQFRKDFIDGAYASRGAETEDTDGDLTIDPQLRVGGQTRGVGTWVLKGVRRLTVTIAGDLLDKVDVPGVAASALCAHLEGKFMPDAGFKRWAGKRDFTKADASMIEADKPTLVFIHGTFSSTAGSFGDLAADPKTWNALTDRYEDRIFALEHHTMGLGPIENALEIVRNLPPNARLHMVSHSRGGMIGELICRAQRTEGNPFDDLDFKTALGDPDDEGFEYRQEQQEQLRELDKLLQERAPRIERFVRVAAPAAGTSLASARLDRWLSILLTALEKIPGGAVKESFDLVSSFTAAVLKKRLDPGKFPGIEAMCPVSPLVRILNRTDIKTAADLTVIAGDLDGSGIWGSVKHWITDLIYAGDHDIVVNTPSMYGGANRTNGVFFFDHGPQVDHFHYFSNERTAKKLKQGLDGEPSDEDLFERRKNLGFLDLETKRQLLKEKQERLGRALVRGERDAKEKPVVFVLPGIMGSALAQDKDDIWVNPWRLVRGHMSRLRIGTQLVKPTQLLAGPYGDLIEHLSVDHAVKAFPYDWRLSLEAEAARLAKDLRETLADTSQPVRLLAHSLGGLLARTMFAQDEQLWNAFRKREGSRLVMLGTPNAGSFKITRVLLGKDKLLRILSLVDLANSKREMVEIVSRFPGILELLPEHEDDYFKSATWKDLAAAAGDGWPAPTAAALRKAGKVRELLKQAKPDPERMLYVAGLANETPVGVELDDGRLRFMATREGDGSVPWKGGILPELRTWYMDAEHGKLADHSPGFDAIDELLSAGDTTKLPQTPPALARDAGGQPFEMTEESIESYPEELELQAAAVGYSFVREEPKRVEPVHLSVYHGDLTFVPCPVMAGHHDGDAILGAEWALDRRLNGRLSDRLALGLYAGRIGSSEIVLDDRRSDGNAGLRPGAVIVGLGEIGKLLPSGLEKSVANGALRYALQIVEEEKAVRGGSPPESPTLAPLCSLVIGSEFGGLTQAESMGAILKGVLRANQALAEQRLSDWVRIDELRFIELYRHRAIHAAQILLRLRDDEALNSWVRVDDVLNEGESGRSRVPPNDAANWWHRVQISSRESDAALLFTTMTGRARADVDVLPLQLENVRRFVRRAVTSSSWNSDVANTLFHLLLPNELKPMALEERNLVLLLGSEAAAYPWELLHDQTSGGADPLVTRGGLIRQLATGERGRTPINSIVKSALVVGNPPTHLPDLPGAEAEAIEVAGQLEQALPSVTKKIGSHADEIQMALFSKPYQLLHLAGHGEIDRRLSETDVHEPHGSTGMVIGEHLYLTPAIVKQLPQVPELVFINCCHLGAMDVERDRRFNLLAANLGTQFIRDGVSAVVAAGWAVNDAAAATFAREFYQRMLSGEQFGDAVRYARKLTYDRHPNINTFGAYQCYGDPSYRLRLQSGRGSSSRRRSPHVSPDHAAYDFDGLRHAVKAAGKEEVGRLRNKIKTLDARMREDWKESSSILNAAIGEAYREVKMFEEAVRAYDRALKPEDADAPVRILEQRGNLYVRMGKAEAKGSAKASQLVRQGLDDLEALLKVAETAERQSLVGSAYRVLHLKRSTPVAGDLTSMAKHYRAAYKLKKDRGDLDLAYPLTNWLSAELGLNPAAEAAKQLKLDGKAFDYREALADASEKAVLKSLKEPDFWTEVMPIDCRLLGCLFDGSLPKQADEIADAYGKMLAGSPAQRDSVAGGVEFHLDLVLSQIQQGSKVKQEKLAAALRKIIAAINAA